MRHTSWLLTTLWLFTILHFASANIFEKPLKLEEKEVHPISQQADSYQLRDTFFYDSDRQRDLFHSVQLYNDKNELLQTIEAKSYGNICFGEKLVIRLH